jgi:hypothetical protein
LWAKLPEILISPTNNELSMFIRSTHRVTTRPRRECEPGSNLKHSKCSENEKSNRESLSPSSRVSSMIINWNALTQSLCRGESGSRWRWAIVGRRMSSSNRLTEIVEDSKSFRQEHSIAVVYNGRLSCLRRRLESPLAILIGQADR